MRVPDCRTDENYNERYLRGNDAEFVRGYDFLTDNVIESFFYNLDIYEDLDLIFDDNKAVMMKGKVDLVKNALLDYIENERDMLITSMIDEMPEEEYAKVREEEKAKDEKEAENEVREETNSN